MERKSFGFTQLRFMTKKPLLAEGNCETTHIFTSILSFVSHHSTLQLLGKVMKQVNLLIINLNMWELVFQVSSIAH
jgi:hypothetical protein